MPPWETDHLVWDVYFTCGIKCSLSFVCTTLLSKLVKQVTHVSWTSLVNVVAQTRNLSVRKHNPVALVWSFPSRPAPRGPNAPESGRQPYENTSLLLSSPSAHSRTADILMCGYTWRLISSRAHYHNMLHLKWARRRQWECSHERDTNRGKTLCTVRCFLWQRLE